MEEVRPGLHRGGKQRVENHRLVVEPEVAALRLEFGKGEAPVEAAAGGLAGRRVARAVDELRQEGSRGPLVQKGNRGEVVDERAARVDDLPEAPGGLVDLVAEKGRGVGVATLPDPVPRCRDERVEAARRLAGGLGELGVVRPGDEGLDVLDAAGQKFAPPLLREGGNAVEALDRIELGGPPQEVEVEAGVGKLGEQPLPSVEDLVELAGCSAVQGGGLELGDGQELSSPREQKGLGGEPAPIGQLMSECSGRVVFSPLGFEVHRSTSSTVAGEGLPGS